MESILSLIRVSRRRRNILLVCCALGVGGYTSYRVYTSTSITRKRRQLYRFFYCLSSLLETAAQGSDCAGILWKDLHSFLLSNQDEVPQSLKQLFKVGQTREFQSSVTSLSRSITHGVVHSLSGRGPVLHDESYLGSALYEDLSYNKEGLRKIGNASRDLGYRESRDGRHSLKERRWRSSGEVDGFQYRDTIEDDYFRRGKLERSGSASRIDGRGDDVWSKEEDGGRHSSWKTSRSYYREKGSWTGGPLADISADGGKGKLRSHSDNREKGDGRTEGLPERLVGKLFSEAGRGFASAVVASAARSLVLSVLEGMQEMNKQDASSKGWTSSCKEPDGWKDTQQKGGQKDGFVEKPTSSRPTSSLQDGLIDFLCSSKGKSVIADCIETFIGTAVSIYLDKTRDINVYEEILSTIAKPAHREPVKELLTTVFNGAVETLVRTSHEVMSVDELGPCQCQPESTRSGDAERSDFTLGKSSQFVQLRSELGGTGEGGKIEGAIDNSTSASPLSHTSDNDNAERLSISEGMKRIKIAFDHSPQNEKVLSGDLDLVEEIMLPPSTSSHINGKTMVFSRKSVESSQGWIDGVSRTLAVPSNRALVLDVAGTMTAEAVRSAIEIVASKVSHSLRGKSKPNELPPEERPTTSRVLNVINKTGELAQATVSKAMVAMTMCLAICLHTLVGPSRQLS